MPEAKKADSRSSGLTLDEYLGRQAAAKAAVGVKTDVQVTVKVKPPPTAVKTIRELIYWEYSKLIAKAAGFDGNYRFIMSRFTKLKNNQMKISDFSEDEDEEMMMERECVYCGAKENLSIDHIIPISKGGPNVASNKVLSCKSCNSSKRDKDIFEWYYIVKKEQEIPKHVWSKYLKLVWQFHVMNLSLSRQKGSSYIHSL
ncbi:MAG: HNH endonuclease [Nitrosopumilaceae archaeon]